MSKAFARKTCAVLSAFVVGGKLIFDYKLFACGC
jgi:hypothetical protein